MASNSIIWDFDGVIVESVLIKADAFSEIYLPYGKEIAESVRGYHLAHGGISRQEKFRYFHRTFLNQEISEEEVKRLSRDFSKRVMRKVIAAPEVAGARELLCDKTFHHFLITGTPEEEIRTILAEKKLLPCFEKVTGAPTKKDAAVEALVKENRIDPRFTVFIGDALEDARAAASQGISFLLRKTPENGKLFADFQGPSVAHFHGAAELILKILSSR